MGHGPHDGDTYQLRMSPYTKVSGWPSQSEASDPMRLQYPWCCRPRTSPFAPDATHLKFISRNDVADIQGRASPGLCFGRSPTHHKRRQLEHRRPLGRLRSQPLLKPTDWFPTEEELTASRGGAPRNDLSVFTSGNAIKPLTITKEYYDSVYDDLSAAGEGDGIMLAAWDSMLVPLKPDVDVTGATSGYHAVFAGVVERGREVSILAWANLLRRGHNSEARDDINNLPASPVNGARATFIFDDRVRSISSSHHHKTLVIAANSSSGKGAHPIAYVGGGLDLTKQSGWVDGELRIHGPAAKDVANNFLARWNSEYKPCQGLGDDFLDFENPGYDHLAPLDYAGSNTTSNLGTQNVQIVRTFSCKYEHYNEFAPFGELFILHARIKAIKNAKNYIYIEDQYFILVPELLEALMEVIPRLQKVIVVAHAPVGQITLTDYEKYLYEMVSPPEVRIQNSA